MRYCFKGTMFESEPSDIYLRKMFPKRDRCEVGRRRKEEKEEVGRRRSRQEEGGRRKEDEEEEEEEGGAQSSTNCSEGGLMM